MKKKLLVTLLATLLCTKAFFAQSTETFEDEAAFATSFTDNGQVFNITDQLQGPIDIRSFSGKGWNGTAADDRFIANHTNITMNVGVAFTISSKNGVPFRLNSMYLKLGDYNQQVNVTGSVTIIGKLAGTVLFTTTMSSGFNKSLAFQKGFTLIDLSTFGGSDNSLTAIDQILISSTSDFNYIALDAFTWTKVPIAAATVQTEVSCYSGSNGSATVTVIGGTPPYSYSWAPSGGSAATASGLIAGTYACTIKDNNSTPNIITKTFTITEPSALTANTSNTAVVCNGGNNGSATVKPTGGTPSYSYSWAPSGGAAATASALTAGTYTCTIKDVNNCSISKNVTIAEPTALTATMSNTAVSCYGGSNGSSTVTPSGGEPAYSYSWAPSGGSAATAFALAAGTYTCTIKDANNCSITKEVTFTDPTALNATTNKTDVSCYAGSSGSATVTPSGGKPSYSYSWAPSGGNAATATALAADTYTCTIKDANNCSITKEVAITQPLVITATASQTNISCNGANSGSATITTSGGLSPYTYSWAPSGGAAATASALTAGTYTCTIKDANNCSISKNISITELATLTATTSQTNIDCNGGNNGSATITASGGSSPYTYSWAPSGGSAATASTLAAGTYTCSIKDANNCSITKEVTFTDPELMIVNTSKIDVSCNGGNNGSATVKILRIPYTYSWEPYGGSAATATGLVAGTYTCTVTYGNNCKIEKAINVNEPNPIINTQLFTICAGDSIIVGIHSYNASGMYKDTFTSKNSCDSSVTTTLTVLPEIKSSRILTICAGDSVIVGNKVYKTSGIYAEVFTAKNNCDSTAIIDLTVLPLNVASQTLTICAGDSLKIGKHFYKISGAYTDTLMSKNTCDSILTTNLTVANIIDNTVQLKGTTLIANATGATYQWFICATMGTIIGATNSSFTVPVAGDYAVVVTINGCSDTSICTNVIINAIANNINNKVLISPNPNTGIFTIKNAPLGDYQIVNNFGQIVKEFKINDNQYQMNMEAFKNGLYYIIGINNNQLFKQKIIINK
ncbi:MAG: T9SS type A sorting domain-containing protein [Bacteroidia bacterium]